MFCKQIVPRAYAQRVIASVRLIKWPFLSISVIQFVNELMFCGLLRFARRMSAAVIGGNFYKYFVRAVPLI